METTNFDSLFTDDALSSAIGDDIFGTGSAEDYEQKLRQKLSQIKNIDRAAELKKKELFRKGKLEYEDNGELIHDSNAMIRAKEIGNAGIRGVDWLLEASENIADFGQGDLIDHYDGFMAENHGKRYSMDNKDFIAARDLGSDATEQLASQYKNAIHDPNADKGIYTLRKFDGYNPDGSTKYIYKYGLAEVGADARYRDQNVQDGFEIVEEKRFAGAEDWEKTWNASQGVLNNRVLDNSIDLVKDFDGNMVTRDEASGINFGSGKTELLNSDLLGTDIGKTQEDYDRNQEYSERLTKANDAIWQNGMYSNPYRAIKSGAASLLVDTADFIFDVLTPGDNTWLNDVKKKENIDKWVGYDRTQSTQALSDAATFWKQGNYFDAITTVVSDPNTMAESIPMMLGMMVPIPGTRAAKVMQITERLNKAKKLKTSLSDIALARHELKAITSASEYKKITELNQMPAKIKAYDHFARNAGFHTIVGELTNNVLDDRIAEKIANGEPGSVSMGEVLSVYALQLPLLAIDRMSFKAILGLGKEGKVLKDAFSSLNSQGKASVVTAITKKAGEMTAAGAGEGVQEYVQTWGEILGAKALVGDNSISDVFSDEQNQKEALMGGLGGLGAGVQMHGLGHALPDAVKQVKKGYDHWQLDDSQKAIKKAKSFADIGKAEGIASKNIMEEIVNEVVNNKNQRMSDMNLDSTADFEKAIDVAIKHRIKNLNDNEQGSELVRKEITKQVLSNIVLGARNKYGKDKDREAFDKTLAFVKKMHDDKNIDFDMSDISNSSNDFLNKFIDIMNTGYTDKSAGSGVNSNRTPEEQAKDNKQRDKAIDDLLASIDSDIANNILLTQGSSISLGDDGNVKIDDDILAQSSDADLAKLKTIIENYRKNGYKKDFADVSAEIANLGYINEVSGKNGKNPTIQLKSSMKGYNNSLNKEFANIDTLKQSLGKRTTLAGPTFSNFLKWNTSRKTKLEPTVNKHGTTSSKQTLRNISDMRGENAWFAQKITDLENILATHEIGDKTLTADQHKKISDALIEAKDNLVQTEKLMQAHENQIADYVKNVLGLKGFDSTDPIQIERLAGAFTNFEADKDGNFSFGPMQIKRFMAKDMSLEESMMYAREGLIRLGLTDNGNFDGTFEGEFEEHSGTKGKKQNSNTGSKKTSKNTSKKITIQEIVEQLQDWDKTIQSIAKTPEKNQSAAQKKLNDDLQEKSAKMYDRLKQAGYDMADIYALVSGKKTFKKKKEAKKEQKKSQGAGSSYDKRLSNKLNAKLKLLLDSKNKLGNKIESYESGKIPKALQDRFEKISKEYESARNEIPGEIDKYILRTEDKDLSTAEKYKKVVLLKALIRKYNGDADLMDEESAELQKPLLILLIDLLDTILVKNPDAQDFINDKVKAEKQLESLNKTTTKEITTEPITGIEGKEIRERFKGKIIIANSGSGKSIAAQHDNVIDGDDLLLEAANEVLGELGKTLRIDTVADLNKVWITIGKENDSVYDEYTENRNKVYKKVGEKAKVHAKNGKTVLIASPRPDIVAVANDVIYQGDVKTLMKNRNSDLRENKIDIDAKKSEAKNKKFLDGVKKLPKMKLKPGQYLSDILFEKKVAESGSEIAKTNGYTIHNTKATKVVYHGSNVDITTFDNNKSGGSKDADLGHYFTNSLENAVYYAVRKAKPDLIENMEAQDDLIKNIVSEIKKGNYSEVSKKYGVFITKAKITLGKTAVKNFNGKNKAMTQEEANIKQQIINDVDTILDRNIKDGSIVSDIYLVKNINNIEILAKKNTTKKDNTSSKETKKENAKEPETVQTVSFADIDTDTDVNEEVEAYDEDIMNETLFVASETKQDIINESNKNMKSEKKNIDKGCE